MTQRQLAYISLAINTIIWAAAFPLVKPALKLVTPYEFLFLRYLIACLISLPLLIILLVKEKPKLKQILKISVIEFIGITLALSFLYEGLKRTSSLEATFIANTSPLFITLGGVLFLREKEEKHEFIGLIIALVGTLILTLEPVITGRSGWTQPSFYGNLLVFGHNIFWSTYLLLAKKRYRSLSKILIGLISLWVGLLSFLVILLLNPREILIQTVQSLTLPPVALAAFYMSVLGSIVAVPAYIFGNDRIEASEASLFFYLQPLIAIPLATLMLKEPFSFYMFFALVLTSIGVIIAEKRFRLAKKRKT